MAISSFLTFYLFFFMLVLLVFSLRKGRLSFCYKSTTSCPICGERCLVKRGEPFFRCPVCHSLNPSSK